MPAFEQETDASGNLVYEPKYILRYFMKDGTELNREEYDNLKKLGKDVYRACLVGCSYHCG